MEKNGLLLNCEVRKAEKIDDKLTKRGEGMTIEEKAQIVSKIFAALDIVPQEQKDQLTGIIIGYSMASQFKESKGA